MRKRNNQVLLRLTDEELEDLNQKAEWANLDREKYIRKVLSDAVVYEWPPHDVFQLSIDLRRIGTMLGDIKFKLYTDPQVDHEMLNIVYKKCWDACDAIMKEFIYPEEKFNKKKGKKK